MTDTTAPRTAAPDDVERLRQQNHENAALRDRENADLRSRVAKYERLMADARERVRNWPADWTSDPPSQEPDGWWRYTSIDHIHEVAALIEGVRAEAIEPLLALVRAAQAAFVAAEFPHGADMSTWSKAEVERFWVDADTRWMEARRTFLTLYVALPESVRVAARKPE